MSLMSARQRVSQVPWDVRKHRQFTNPIPSLRAAGLMCRVRMLLSRVGLPGFTDWNTIVGPVDLDGLVPPSGTSGSHCYRLQLQRVDLLDDVIRNCHFPTV